MKIYKSDISKFKESTVWKALRDELEGSIDNMRVMLMSLDPFAQATELARTQGRLEAVTAFLAMPDDLYADAVEERDKKEEEEKDE